LAQDSYTLFGDHRSGNCYKAALILKLTGRTFRWLETDILKQQSRTEEFLSINPNGRVPLLQLPGGEYLAESNAMLIHLSERSRYLPDDDYARAVVFQWLFFEQYSHEPYIAVSRFLRHFDHGLAIDPERMSMLHERGLQALNVMEQTLLIQPYLAGRQLTIADIALYAYTHVAGDSGFDTGSFPAVSGWLARVAQQDGHFDMKDMPP